MSTETVNLNELSDQELSERADDVRDAMNATIDDADDTEYGRWSDESARIETEQQRRAKPKPAPKKAAPKVPTTRSELLTAKREELVAAEAALAEFAGLRQRDPNKPPPMGAKPGEEDPGAGKPEAFMQVEQLKRDIAALETRAPFVEMSDDDVASRLEDASIERERLLVEAKRLTDEGRHRAAAKATREAGQLQDQLMPLVAEDAARKQDSRNAILVDQWVERKAAQGRETALASWKAALTQREADLEHAMSVNDGVYTAADQVQQAKASIEAIEKAIAEKTKYGSDELALAREEVEKFTTSVTAGSNAVEVSSW